MPSMMWGIGSEPAESIETWALWRSTSIAERMTTTPRSKGPTVAESIATIEKGEPWKGPAR
jgi:hypothetical protein